MIRQIALLSLLHAVTVYGLPQPAATIELNGLTNSLATLSCDSDASPEMQKLTRLLPKVLEHAKSSSNNSWEYGALCMSLLEVYDPHFTPFEWDKDAVKNRQIPWEVLDITQTVLADYDWSGAPDETTTKNATRTQAESTEGWLGEYLTEFPPVPVKNLALIPAAGAQGDPCSLGPVVWMLAEMADRQEIKDRGGFRNPEEYAWAVGNQKWNLTLGPQDSNGTYSQRQSEFAIWADMGYMVPPFLAHLGLATNSSELLLDALRQFGHESEVLLEQNMYKHVSQDWGKPFWATGNGWMTYGLMRVLASVYAAGKQEEFKDLITKTEKGDGLVIMIGKVFKAVFEEINDESLLPNNMLNASTHGESAGTALFVAAFYRYSVMFPNAVDQYMRDKAEQAFKGVMKKLFDDGWLTQVVDPSGNNGFEITPRGHSPEGQSFLGMLWAARTAADHFKKKTDSIASGIVSAYHQTSTDSSSSSVDTATSSSSVDTATSSSTDASSSSIDTAISSSTSQ